MLTEKEKTEITNLGKLDPELEQLLKNVQLPQLNYDEPQPTLVQKLRTGLEGYRTPADPSSGINERSLPFAARDGHSLRLLIFSAAEPRPEPRPLVVFFHGGGYTMGAPEDVAVLCRHLVTSFGAVCIAPSYRLSPEHPFPVGAHDAWDAMRHIAAHAADWGAVPASGFLVGGVSAGSNLAAGIAHRARDEGLEAPLTGVFLQAASVVRPTVVPQKYRDRYLSNSQPECLKDVVLPLELKQVFYECYRPDLYSALSSPFNWPTGHRDLPPHFLQVCGGDMLRDDGLLFESVLREESGVETRMNVYPGLPHVFWAVFRTLKATKRANEDFMNGIDWLLKR